MVEKIARTIFIPLTVGGGVRKLEDIRNLLNAGADKVGINSAAITNPDFVNDAASRFGNQCIVVSIDAKRVGDIDGQPRWRFLPMADAKPQALMRCNGR